MTLPNTDTTPLKGQLFGTPVLQKFTPICGQARGQNLDILGADSSTGGTVHRLERRKSAGNPSLPFPGRDSSATFMGIRLTSGCVIFCNQPKMRSYRIPSPAATGTGMGHFPPIIRPVNQPIPERTGIARGPNHRGDPNPAKVFKHPANAPNALQIYAGRRRSVNLWISRTRMDAISGQDS